VLVEDEVSPRDHEEVLPQVDTLRRVAEATAPLQTRGTRSDRSIERARTLRKACEVHTFDNSWSAGRRSVDERDRM